LAVHQILDLIILVRVQASQPLLFVPSGILRICLFAREFVNLLPTHTAKYRRVPRKFRLFENKIENKLLAGRPGCAGFPRSGFLCSFRFTGGLHRERGSSEEVKGYNSGTNQSAGAPLTFGCHRWTLPQMFLDSKTKPLVEGFLGGFWKSLGTDWVRTSNSPLVPLGFAPRWISRRPTKLSHAGIARAQLCRPRRSLLEDFSVLSGQPGVFC
jgi:hypothetical protein